MKYYVSSLMRKNQKCDNHRTQKAVIRLTKYEKNLNDGIFLCEECVEEILNHYGFSLKENEVEAPEELSGEELDIMMEENENVEIGTETQGSKEVEGTDSTEETETVNEDESRSEDDTTDNEEETEVEVHEPLDGQESLFGDIEDKREPDSVDELLAEVDELVKPKKPEAPTEMTLKDETEAPTDYKELIAKATTVTELRGISKEIGCNLRSMTNIANIKTKLIRHLESKEVE